MAEYTFASLPSVSIARTKFNRTFHHNVSFNLGELVVLGVDEVIPGSTHKLDFGSLIRMSTPIAPIMDDIQFDIFSFFVPARLCWSNWKRFMGENTTGSGAINALNSDKTIPYYTCKGSIINTIADDMGIPPANPSGQDIKVNILPFRGFQLIYDRFFRNQNVENPHALNLSDSVASNIDAANMGLYNSNDGITTGSRWTAYKLPDYFTSSLPYAQKGDPVSIFPAGAKAPVVTGDTHNGGSVAMRWQKLGDHTTIATYGHLGTQGNGVTALDNQALNSGSTQVIPDNLWTDLTNAVNTTINDLRFAFQLQKFLEKDAAYGSRYWELLHAHYSVTAPDASLQDPQLLGRFKFDINIQQVNQTTGFVDPTNTSLGTPGANSTTGKNGNIFTASFVEHGYLITIGVARQKSHTYSQGLDRMWSRQVRTDFYFPVFANLGAQVVKKKELFAGASTDEQTFGFQEAWAEYRFKNSYNSGYLNPVRSGGLDYWTLAENFANAPALAGSFLKSSRDNLARCLVTGTAGPDFVGSFYFRDTTVNPMPLYSIPGFADHH